MGESFGLPMKKGFFPHQFNTQEMLDKIIKFPEPQEFHIGRLKQEEQDEFSKWYEETKRASGGLYSVRSELLAYCRDDVNLLFAATSEFAKLMADITGGWQCFAVSSTVRFVVQ